MLSTTTGKPKEVKTWSIIDTASVFGGLFLVGTLGANDTLVRQAAGYGCVGLFLGGLLNGFVNKVRRDKNASNLKLAVDAYNAQVTKKKKGQ